MDSHELAVLPQPFLASPLALDPGRQSLELNLQGSMETDENHEDLGYLKLAKFMANHRAVAIFELFPELNHYNLLAFQAELSTLRDEFLELSQEEDYKALDLGLTNSAPGCDLTGIIDSRSERWQKFLEIRDKIHQYNVALLQQCKLQKHSTPTRHNLNMLQRFLAKPEGCHNRLRGGGSDIWDTQSGKPTRRERSHFIAVYGGHEDRDIVSHWVYDIFLRWWTNVIGSLRFDCERERHNDIEAGFVEYDDEATDFIIHGVVTIVSALLTTLPTFILFFVKDMRIRLVLVMLFTMLFSISLGLFSKAKKSEIFAATAGFTAVQVVFVGSVVV